MKKPTIYLENDNLFVNGKFVRQGMFYTAGEIVCYKFNSCGKIRDLA